MTAIIDIVDGVRVVRIDGVVYPINNNTVTVNFVTYDLSSGTNSNDSFANSLDGGPGSDLILGLGGNDHLNGNSGRDLLYGGEGNDRLDGDGDEDVLFGGAGNDFLRGGIGLDKLYGESGDDSLYGGEQADKLYGGIGEDFLSGGVGDDELYGNADDDALFGSAGDDELNGGAGNDTLLGGYDDDIYIYEAGNGLDILRENGGTGNDTVRINYVEADVRAFKNGDDLVITNSVVYDSLVLGASIIDYSTVSEGVVIEDFYLAGAEIIETLEYDNGNPAVGNNTFNLQLLLNSAPVVENRIADQSFDENSNVNYTIPLNVFSDPEGDAITLTAKLADDTQLPNWLSFNGVSFTGTPPLGFNGVLNIIVVASDAFLNVVDRFELVIGTPPAKNIINGTAADDILQGTNDRDIIDGLEGRDSIFSAGTSVTIKFSDLTHSFRTGSDSSDSDSIANFLPSVDKIDLRGLGFTNLDIDGGGTDVGELRLAYSSASDRTYVRSDQNDFQFYFVGDYRTTVRGDDFIFQDENAPVNVIDGTAGQDILVGTSASDVLDGLEGRDTLTGGASADIFKFSDITHSTDTNSDRIVDFESNLDKIDLSGLGFWELDTDGGLTKTGELRLAYSSGSDRTYVRSDDIDFEFFFDGDRRGDVTDTDFIFQGDSSPAFVFDGTSGRDTIVGTSGRDIIDGKGDRDTLTGGASADTFKFSDILHSTRMDKDRITDFEVGLDKIDLSSLGLFDSLDADGGLTEDRELRLAYSSNSDRTYIRNDQIDFEFYLDGNYETVDSDPYTDVLTDADFIF